MSPGSSRLHAKYTVQNSPFSEILPRVFPCETSLLHSIVLYHWMLFSVRYNFVYNWCNLWHKFQKITKNLQVNKGRSGSSEKILGAGKPSAKKAKYDKQKIYDEK